MKKSIFIPLMPGWGITFFGQQLMNDIKRKRPSLLKPDSKYEVATLVYGKFYASWLKRN